MLKFEHIPVGAYIRAYDFEPCRGREDKYIEGEVVEHLKAGDICPYHALVVKVEVDHLDRHQDYMYVPMETSADYNHRIFEL